MATADFDSVSTFNETVLEQNPQEHWAWFITAGFLFLGLIVAYFTPANERKVILAVVIAITIVLAYFCIFPVSSQIWADKLGWLNSLMGVT